jgi:transaldolase
MLARDTEATIEAAQRLAAALAAPNVMIKIPATLEGLPAIEAARAHGINVNVTLLFSLQRYTQVLSAWQSGMRRVGAPGGTASVASFFVSRIDTLVDRALEELGGEEALALRGRVAVASARLAYRHFTKHMASPAFVELSARGGRMQRLLWGSTGTKNEAYSDVKYVEELIGRHTVNTMPPATLEAFMDHGVVAETLLLDVDDAQQTIERLERMGISLAAVTAQLEREGIEAFADSHRQLLDALTAKRQTLAEE